MTVDDAGTAQDADRLELAPAVVVGVDGSAAGDTAARWAADEAVRRNLPLRVAHAVPPTGQGAFPAGLAAAAIDRQRRAEILLAASTEPVRRSHPGLTIEAHAFIGQPTAVALTRAAQSAELLVLGSRGRGGFTTLLLGSTAVQVLELAEVPVAIVRPAHRDPSAVPADGPVVVGVDGSEPSRRALRFAIREAALRKTTLTAVHALAIANHPGLASLRTAGTLDMSFLTGQAADVLDNAVSDVRADFPDVDVAAVVVDDSPVPALVDASREAQLLVVGSRGRSALSGLVLGSVSHSAVRGAGCPVAVVR